MEDLDDQLLSAVRYGAKGCGVLGLGCLGFGCLFLVGSCALVWSILPDAPEPPPPVTLERLGDVDGALLEQHNDLREAPLVIDPVLTRTASRYAREMAEHEFLAHEDRNGELAIDRARAEGYVGDIGENIAAGHDSVDEVIQGWIGSPGHHRNMLRPEWKDVGFGVAVGEYFGRRTYYWVVVFGRRKG